MKKILALVLSAGMALSLAACGGSSTASTTAAATTAAPAATTAATAAPAATTAAAAAPAETTAAPAAAPAAEQITLRLSHSCADTHPYHLGAQKFAELVDQKTNGAVKIDIFHSAQLGDERANIEDLQMGTLDIAVSSTGPLGNFVEDFLILDLPFLFTGYDHAHAVLDGEIGQNLITKLDDIGVVGGAFWENGFREMTNSKHPINSVADCSGLKLRCMENQVHMDAFAALGMDPTPMAWSEVFTALQQGTIDGQENPIAVIYSNKVYEAQKYLAITNHVYSPSMILFSKAVFDKLDPAYQKALMEAAVESADYERSCCEDNESSQIEEMKGLGLEVTYPDTTEFQSAMAPVYEKYAAQFGQENIDAIVNYAH